MTTQWAYAHKAEQRSLARQARRNRAHSAVTQKLIVIEEGKVNSHAAFLMFASGQLRFLGLSRRYSFSEGWAGVAIAYAASAPASGRTGAFRHFPPTVQTQTTMTTRTHFAGQHQVDALVNGRVFGLASFELIQNP